MKVLIDGASDASDLPGFDPSNFPGDVFYAPDGESLQKHLPDTEVLLAWNIHGLDLEKYWQYVDQLKWIHRCAAGVDTLLFPALAESDIKLSNARGIFDHAMAEYVLAYMLYEVKRFGETLQAQKERRWQYKWSGTLVGQSAAVFGVGSIGRKVATVLKALGVQVIGVGRSERDDPLLGTIRAVVDAHEIAARVDWVVGALPSTPYSNNTFDADFFAAMRPSARFINIGRGRAQDENALLNALQNGTIAGAMIDVFQEEPLPESSGLWNAPNLFLSPHMSGDYFTHYEDLVKLFVENMRRYVAGETLLNIVDKKLGFITDKP
jgi:phosphoglycerate dehydrogenase-like enzyme